MSTNQCANPRWRMCERGDRATISSAHLWNRIGAGQRPLEADPGRVLHTLSTSVTTGPGVSSTSEPELSPGPVDNGLSGRARRHLDSPLGRSTRDDTEPVRRVRERGARLAGPASYSAVG